MTRSSPFLSDCSNSNPASHPHKVVYRNILYGEDENISTIILLYQHKNQTKNKTRDPLTILLAGALHLNSKYIYLYLFLRLFFLKRVQSLFEKYKFTLIILNSINEDRPKLFMHIPIVSFWFSQRGSVYLIGFDVNRFK